MALTVRTRDIPKIPGAVRFYRVSAYVTGVLLLALVVEVVIKYTPIQREMQLGGGAFFVPNGTAGEAPGTFNLSIAILIAHGWLYVVYLFADFRLWSIMRWRPSRFLLIALGGVIPFMSFVVEHRMQQAAMTTYHELTAAQQREKESAR
ncbi:MULTISPECIES: DUF3817 domain-containing protein [unclassified Curtobacterium]|uniref:DUF3817 domain-containing protein n=1 Tax=unclassified Curtobacterium TaxID=257496 RepID=UPI00226B27DC|nr:MULTISPECIES: DUF3817 domain-containing protein [unclassified Curtobacterium]